MIIQKNTNTINTESIDGVAHAPSINDRTKRAASSAQPELDLTKDNARSGAHENNTDKDEYVVERIVPEIGEGDTFRYVVQLYGYGPMGNTVEPTNYTPHHFITH